MVHIIDPPINGGRSLTKEQGPLPLVVPARGPEGSRPLGSPAS